MNILRSLGCSNIGPDGRSGVRARRPVHPQPPLRRTDHPSACPQTRPPTSRAAPLRQDSPQYGTRMTEGLPPHFPTWYDPYTPSSVAMPVDEADWVSHCLPSQFPRVQLDRQQRLISRSAEEDLAQSEQKSYTQLEPPSTAMFEQALSEHFQCKEEPQNGDDYADEGERFSSSDRILPPNREPQSRHKLSGLRTDYKPRRCRGDAQADSAATRHRFLPNGDCDQNLPVRDLGCCVAGSAVDLAGSAAGSSAAATGSSAAATASSAAATGSSAVAVAGSAVAVAGSADEYPLGVATRCGEVRITTGELRVAESTRVVAEEEASSSSSKYLSSVAECSGHSAGLIDPTAAYRKSHPHLLSSNPIDSSGLREVAIRPEELREAEFRAAQLAPSEIARHALHFEQDDRQSHFGVSDPFIDSRQNDDFGNDTANASSAATKATSYCQQYDSNTIAELSSRSSAQRPLSSPSARWGAGMAELRRQPSETEGEEPFAMAGVPDFAHELITSAVQSNGDFQPQCRSPPPPVAAPAPTAVQPPSNTRTRHRVVNVDAVELKRSILVEELTTIDTSSDSGRPRPCYASPYSQVRLHPSDIPAACVCQNCSALLPPDPKSNSWVTESEFYESLPSSNSRKPKSVVPSIIQITPDSLADPYHTLSYPDYCGSEYRSGNYRGHIAGCSDCRLTDSRNAEYRNADYRNDHRSADDQIADSRQDRSAEPLRRGERKNSLVAEKRQFWEEKCNSPLPQSPPRRRQSPLAQRMSQVESWESHVVYIPRRKLTDEQSIKRQRSVKRKSPDADAHTQMSPSSSKRSIPAVTQINPPTDTTRLNTTEQPFNQARPLSRRSVVTQNSRPHSPLPPPVTRPNDSSPSLNDSAPSPKPGDASAKMENLSAGEEALNSETHCGETAPLVQRSPPLQKSIPTVAPPPPSSDTELPKGVAAELPKGVAAELPKGVAAELPKGGAAELPKGGAAEVPKGGAAEVPKGAAAEVPKGAAAEVPKGAAAVLVNDAKGPQMSEQATEGVEANLTSDYKVMIMPVGECKISSMELLSPPESTKSESVMLGSENLSLVPQYIRDAPKESEEEGRDGKELEEGKDSSREEISPKEETILKTEQIPTKRDGSPVKENGVVGGIRVGDLSISSLVVNTATIDGRIPFSGRKGEDGLGSSCLDKTSGDERTEGDSKLSTESSQTKENFDELPRAKKLFNWGSPSLSRFPVNVKAEEEESSVTKTVERLRESLPFEGLAADPCEICREPFDVKISDVKNRAVAGDEHQQTPPIIEREEGNDSVSGETDEEESIDGEGEHENTSSKKWVDKGGLEWFKAKSGLSKVPTEIILRLLSGDEMDTLQMWVPEKTDDLTKEQKKTMKGIAKKLEAYAEKAKEAARKESGKASSKKKSAKASSKKQKKSCTEEVVTAEKTPVGTVDDGLSGGRNHETKRRDLRENLTDQMGVEELLSRTMPAMVTRNIGIVTKESFLAISNLTDHEESGFCLHDSTHRHLVQGLFTYNNNSKKTIHPSIFFHLTDQFYAILWPDTKSQLPDEDFSLLRASTAVSTSKRTLIHSIGREVIKRLKPWERPLDIRIHSLPDEIFCLIQVEATVTGLEVRTLSRKEILQRFGRIALIKWLTPKNRYFLKKHRRSSSQFFGESTVKLSHAIPDGGDLVWRDGRYAPFAAFMDFYSEESVPLPLIRRVHTALWM